MWALLLLSGRRSVRCMQHAMCGSRQQCYILKLLLALLVPAAGGWAVPELDAEVGLWDAGHPDLAAADSK